MKKLVALSAMVLMLSFSAFAKGSKSGSWDGWVSDEKCGAKVNADCAKKCIGAGQKMVPVDTPTTVHHGHAAHIQQQRATVLLAAYSAHPERFVHQPPVPPALPRPAYINPPPQEVLLTP